MTRLNYVYKYPKGWVNLADGVVLEQGTPGGGGGQPTPMLVGGSVGTKAGIDNVIYQGRTQVARIYFGQSSVAGLNGSTNADVKTAQAQGCTAIIISFKDHNTANVNAFLKTFPPSLKIYACYWHEPEDDAVPDPVTGVITQTNAQWRSRWTALSPIIKANGCIPTQILMGWTFFAANRDPNDWSLPSSLVDVYGIDFYFNNADPTDMMNRLATWAKKFGYTRIGIGECGANWQYATRTAKTTTFRALLDSCYADRGLSVDYATIWNSYDADKAGTITWDARMLKASYYNGNPQTKRVPVPADWDTAYADAWFGPVGG